MPEMGWQIQRRVPYTKAELGKPGIDPSTKNILQLSRNEYLL
jgi:hypothetical protein